MKNKHFGFTLIELLVVIVIIGILATISTATFKKYFGKARDAARNTSVANIALMIKVDGADKWDDDKYIYDLDDTNDVPDMDELFARNDYRLPRAENNLCYLIGMGDGVDEIGDDNEFFIATWGEESGSVNTSSPGVIVDGTEAARNAVVDYLDSDAFADEDAQKAAFNCDSGILAAGDFTLIRNDTTFVLPALRGSGESDGESFIGIDNSDDVFFAEFD